MLGGLLRGSEKFESAVGRAIISRESICVSERVICNEDTHSVRHVSVEHTLPRLTHPHPKDQQTLLSIEHRPRRTR